MTGALPVIAGSNFGYQRYPLRHCFAQMAAAGRTDFELWGIVGHAHLPWLSDAQARALCAQAADYGLRIRCLTPEQVSYPVNIASPDRDLRRHSLRGFRRAAQLAAELGAELLFLTAGCGSALEEPERGFARSAEALAEICGYAHELGLRCVLEPLQPSESNLVTTAGQTAAMLEAVRAPNLGVTLDTVAMAVAGESVEDYWRSVGDRLWHVHLIDGRPAGHLAWGDGWLDLRGILRDLVAGGYAGLLTVELFGEGKYHADPGAAHRRSARAIEQVLGELSGHLGRN
ncbi:sugar phosphate isomerase/epimerase family protein [Glutamicibacter sp. X7]